jgi:hypothetical protein
VFVHALVSSVRTHPEPAVLLILHRLNEEFAHLICGRLRIPVFTQNHVAQLLLVPIHHLIVLLGLLLRLLLSISGIRVQAPLLCLALDIGVVRELAFAPFIAMALFEELAEYGFRIDAEGHFLHLDWLEKLGDLSLGVFRGFLFLLALQFLGFFFLLVGRLCRPSGCFDSFDLLLGGATFFLVEKSVAACVRGGA